MCGGGPHARRRGKTERPLRFLAGSHREMRPARREDERASRQAGSREGWVARASWRASHLFCI